MDILLIRHFESIKNQQTSFSSLEDMEELTDNGIIKGKIVAENLKEFLNNRQLKANNIYCAKSVRAEKTAEIIASTISKSIKIVSFPELLSHKSNELMGKTKKEASKTHPQFIFELSLYDAGLYNAYNFHRNDAKEEKRLYEEKVVKCIQKITQNNVDENVKIIILHYSSITAAVIHYAREVLNYPKDYYGKIIADNGSVFWVQHTKNQKKFLAANVDSQQLYNFGGEKNVIRTDNTRC